MALVEVIPGYLIGDGEPLTNAKLRAMAQPVVNLTTDLFNQLSAFKNGFINGNLQLWQRGTGARTCSAAAKTWQADRWFVRPVGASVTYARDAALPAGAVAAYSALITGNAAVTTVDFGQRIEAVDAHSNWKRERIFSAWVYNNTGTAFVPKLLINTPSSADNYAVQGNQVTATLQTCPNGGWTQVSYAFDGSTITNVDNGLELVLQLPDGALNAGGKTVNITQLQCEPGTVVTAQEPRLITHELLLCQRYCLALDNQVLGFASTTNNLPNKGIFTLPTTMRIKPVFNSTNTNIADGVADFFTYVGVGPAGTPVISGYAGNIVMAIANQASNWNIGDQINLTCVFTAEDQT